MQLYNIALFSSKEKKSVIIVSFFYTFLTFRFKNCLSKFRRNIDWNMKRVRNIYEKKVMKNVSCFMKLITLILLENPMANARR